MGVNINETGRDDPVRRVDFLATLGVNLANCRDQPAINGDVTFE